VSFAIALTDEQWELVADLFDPPGAERPQGLATGVMAAAGPLPVIIPNRETITVADTLRSCTIGERRAMALGVAYMPFRRSSS